MSHPHTCYYFNVLLYRIKEPTAAVETARYSLQNNPDISNSVGASQDNVPNTLPIPTSADMGNAVPFQATAATDPPDEVIQRVVQQPQAPQAQPAPPNTPPKTWLAGIVATMKSGNVYKLRTIAALCCVVLLTVKNFIIGGHVISYVYWTVLY